MSPEKNEQNIDQKSNKRILEGVDEEVARQALTLAASKLPIRTKIVVRGVGR